MAQEGRDEKGKFTAGHLFSIGNNGGQEPEYSDPDDRDWETNTFTLQIQLKNHSL